LKNQIDSKQSQALVYIKFVDAQYKIRDLLNHQGYRVAVLNGKVKASDRTKIINDMNAGMYDILLTNVLRGIDLKTCDNCILYTIDPNPQKMVQFEGRMTREFDIEYKSVFLLVSEWKEKDFVEETLKLRVNASAAFSKTGNSMVLEAIVSDNNKEFFKTN
jgi:superfamily II DNA/RNA helicase